ncbi:hypothetical protein RZN22_17535 [Bacillaceae bacterium S4-13-58]
MLLRWYIVYKKGDLVNVDGTIYKIADVTIDYNLSDGLLITILLEKCKEE